MVSPTNGLPYHEWLIEFESPPKNLLLFEKTIDKYLQEKNSYYKDLIKGNVLRSLKITLISKMDLENTCNLLVNSVVKIRSLGFQTTEKLLINYYVYE